MKSTTVRSNVVRASRDAVLRVSGVKTRDDNALVLIIEELTKDAREAFEAQMRTWLLEADRYTPFSTPEVLVNTEVLREPSVSFDAQHAVTRSAGETRVIVTVRAHLL